MALGENDAMNKLAELCLGIGHRLSGSKGLEEAVLWGKKSFEDDKLIKNYGIGAQIIKSLQIKNMILVTRSRKKVVGLDGYGIKITKQEIIK